MPNFRISVLEFENAIVLFSNLRPRIGLAVKFREKFKLLKFETKSN